MLKIAQISPYYTPHHGGVESFVRDISVELTRLGHELTVITSRNDRSLPAEEVINGVTVRRVPLLITLLRTPIPRGLHSRIMDEFDVMHAHTPPPSFAYLASRRLKRESIPSVVTYHCDSDLPSRLAGPVVRFLDRRISSSIIAGYSRIVVTTETYASTSANTWRIAPDIVPVGADTRRFFPNPEDRLRTRRRLGIDGKGIVLFVGRLVRHKGVQYLIEAMKHTGSQTRLMIAGDGEYAPRLKRAARLLSDPSKVTFIGDVPDPVLPSIYRAADVLVVPSTSRLEAFGISAIEAMASGTPVVVSDIPGVREIINDGVQGLRSEPMNPSDMASKINTILENAVLRQAMAEACIVRAREFSSRVVAERLLEIYRAVVTSHNS
ncbi:MAG: glycosyltransferase family 4 protein [Thermoplasmata archaeon]|nr:glycosyltransferase family 4 protein [Candidatus Sysuiplasma acidicola]MBX8637062.1 glycosyltransferase family 4 protein [Candidatus Sysuiplasma acidicola]MBX8645439.1 glycosyltransferase family 4 protein [Candidatus Sysuiplasma acidicola]MDH2905067.1 glycosyltransferase family 4 protein [Methanomassiliicoccales archaeon]